MLAAAAAAVVVVVFLERRCNGSVEFLNCSFSLVCRDLCHIAGLDTPLLTWCPVDEVVYSSRRCCCFFCVGFLEPEVAVVGAMAKMEKKQEEKEDDAGTRWGVVETRRVGLGFLL